MISFCWIFFQPVSSQNSSSDIFTAKELEEIYNYNPYDELHFESFHDGMIQFGILGCHGFINKFGQIVFLAKHAWTRDFHDGLAHVYYDKNKGMYIDRMGNIEIETSTLLAGDFHEGLACIYDDHTELWGFINKQGNLVIPYRYDLSQVYDMSYFSEGLANVRRNNQWGFINSSGQEVISIKYDWARPFSEGLASVEKGGKYGFIDRHGRVIIPLKYDDVKSFSEGLACVKKDGKWGCINKQGQIVIPLRYDGMLPYSEGYAAVNIKDDWGFIDKSGRVVIPLKYYQVYSFSEGFARVDLCDLKDIFTNTNGHLCYTSRKTKKIVDSGYLKEKYFDLISAKKNMVFIDKTGKVCFPNLKSKGDFHEGFACVSKKTEKGERYMLLNKTGGFFNVHIDAQSLYNVGQDQENQYNEELEMPFLKRALSNYLKSANLGNLSACYKIGYYYYSGIGFKKNYAEAAKWLEKSLTINNNGENYRYLAYCYFDGGDGLVKNESKAFSLFLEGAKTGNEYCEYALAVCYRKGLGCQADIVKASKYADLVYAKNKSEYKAIYVICHNELAYYYLHRKDYNNALISIEQAMKAQPNDAGLYDSKGEILLKMGKKNEAVKIWHMILKINPHFLEDYPEGTDFYLQLKAKKLI